MNRDSLQFTIRIIECFLEGFTYTPANIEIQEDKPSEGQYLCELPLDEKSPYGGQLSMQIEFGNTAVGWTPDRAIYVALRDSGVPDPLGSVRFSVREQNAEGGTIEAEYHWWRPGTRGEALEKFQNNIHRAFGVLLRNEGEEINPL